jgi:ATP-binding cassette subfamily E protein 1
MRIAVVDKNKCHPEKCGMICISSCPGVKLGKETIKIDNKKAVIDENLCTGCGICVHKCPFKAIHIINLPEEIGEPLHQYGKNGFRIYGKPSIKQGKIGILGRNGIGKSTILKIISGIIRPNFGMIDKNLSDQEILEKFKGTEFYNYMKEILEKKIKVVYKPQEVDQIPKFIDCKVKEILEKSDEKGMFEDIVKRFNLEKIFDRKLSELSGGELQKVAIAISLMKKGDIYFFDEPTSFLDIKQRIIMTKTIDEIKEPVYIVEHDLLSLDYLTDYVFVLYGKPGAYGIISSLKSARNGINEYLEGFLKAENVRIRDKPVKFNILGDIKWENREKIEYPEISVKYDGFELIAKSGEVYKGEIIGILGENGIGKSSFLRELSKKLEMKISYKPQYINIDYNGSVISFINSIEDLDREVFESELKVLIEDILMKNVSDLSGGERQRLFIVACLARKADIYLLDEPTAFLDIEQRFVLADKIRKLNEKRNSICFIVDHDLMFIETISNRLIIFTGEPSIKGFASEPKGMKEGMNEFLKILDITLRRDPDTKRIRFNKVGSQKDQKQRKEGKFYDFA